jgi:hypothetical protein
MKCQDVRRSLSLLVEEQLPLTEWALLQTHLRDCAECRKELDRAQTMADERGRARRRGTIRTSLVAAAVVLVVAGGSVYVYQDGLPGLPHWDTFRLPFRGTAPPPSRSVPPAARREAEPPASVVPAPIAPPRASPPSVRPKAVVEPTPRAPLAPVAPTPEPPPRLTRPAAIVEVPPEERMPTQARPPVSVSAPPDAEAMPTQAPAGSGTRGR